MQQPTFAERREAARVVLLAEAIEAIDAAAHEARYRVHRVLKGDWKSHKEPRIALSGEQAPRPGTLAILLAEPAWSAIPVDETSAAYFVRAPALRLPAAERLPYFVPYLEYRDAAVAGDAHAEFGRAALDDVARVARLVPMASLRAWIVDDDVRETHKGLYGLLLGLASDETDRRLNTELLERLIAAPSNDFRAGFDGVLGGYLLLSGEPGLERLGQRFIANKSAAHGDVLHLLTALRFYREYGKEISPARLAQAVRPLLTRPEFAAAVIVDLARWQAWDATPEVVRLATVADNADPAVQRAAIGYLLACPSDEARRVLSELRVTAPERVAEAERAGALFGAGR
ncbi:MAG TPA: hypothetical protein VHZ24_22265 [Pirellulales bacterium]|nr:hypothetical protein [Pirellulales bacterium]